MKKILTLLLIFSSYAYASLNLTSPEEVIAKRTMMEYRVIQHDAQFYTIQLISANNVKTIQVPSDKFSRFIKEIQNTGHLTTIRKEVTTLQ